MELAHFYVWSDQFIFCRGAMPWRRTPRYSYMLGVVPGGGSIDVRGGDGKALSLHAFVLRPACERTFRINRCGLVSLHLDPDRDECRALDRFLGERDAWELPRALARPLEREIGALYHEDESCASAQAVMLQLLHGLVARYPGPGTEPVVRAVAARLKAHPHGSVQLSTLARGAGISARWLTTVFHRETGVSLKRYLLWAKITAALRMFCTEASLTDIALATGFADGAHLSRSIRSFTGLAPRVLRDTRHVLFHSCDPLEPAVLAPRSRHDGGSVQAAARAPDYALRSANDPAPTG